MIGISLPLLKIYNSFVGKTLKTTKLLLYSYENSLQYILTWLADFLYIFKLQLVLTRWIFRVTASEVLYCTGLASLAKSSSQSKVPELQPVVSSNSNALTVQAAVTSSCSVVLVGAVTSQVLAAGEPGHILTSLQPAQLQQPVQQHMQQPLIQYEMVNGVMMQI